MPSSRDGAGGTAVHCDNGDGPSCSLLRGAEFAVVSAISVREQQKTRLLDMVAALSPPPQAADPATGRRFPPYRRAQASSPPSLHVIGDVLLLLRAASVNVVERVQEWRQQLHQGRPLPYLHESCNYLLTMCHDTDYLDKVDLLVEWLGFPLERNPFITRDTIDQSHDDSLSSFLATQTVSNDDHPAGTHLPALRPRRKNGSTKLSTSAGHAKTNPPPSSLILPLASIMPCNDAVDGGRVLAAQRALLNEQSLHGDASLLQTTRKCIQRLAQTAGTQYDRDSAVENSKLSLYEQLSAVASQTRRVAKEVSRVQLGIDEAKQVLAKLDIHMQWIEKHRQQDDTVDQRIRQCQDKYRLDTVKLCTSLGDRLRNVLALLQQKLAQLQSISTVQKQQAQALGEEKDRLQHARKLLQRQQQQQEPTRAVPMKRLVRTKRHIQVQPSSTQSQPPAKRLLPLPQFVEIAEAATLQQRKLQRFHDLERKRAKALEERAALLREKTMEYEREQVEIDRRRTESALMKVEDRASRAFQHLVETRRQLQQRRALFDRISATAIFKCSHEMSGKTFLVSVYEQKPRGYTLEGIRVAAYDPVTSSTFSLALTIRQFDSYGYGRSREGLRAFCKWLCLLYEKRRRRFRLVWVGAPCPPPLRVRDYDLTLICAHKEGVKLPGRSGFALVAVYVRSDAPDLLRIVCASVQPGSETLVEHSVHARHLFSSGDFALVDGNATGDSGFAAWRHLYGASTTHPVLQEGSHASAHFFSDVSGGWNEYRHVYSGSTLVEGVQVDAHIYDANPTEYVIVISESSTHPPVRASEESASTSVDSPTISLHRQVALLKREVNPYQFALPPEGFRDLLGCVAITPVHDTAVERGEKDASLAAWRAIASPKWREKLSKYVRMLRLAKFGCKVAGVLCLITMHLVQLKTEFRAHLLFELTPVGTTAADGCKQSLFISLSDYLRCGVVMHRLGLVSALDGDSECQTCARSRRVDPLDHQCLDNDDQHHAQDEDDVYGYSTESTCCTGCLAAQYARIGALRDVLASLVAAEEGTAWAQSTSDLMEHVVHQECCDACGSTLPSLLAVLGPDISLRHAELADMMERYYCRCFVYGELVSNAAYGLDYDASMQRKNSLADDFVLNIHQRRVAVLLNADFGLTVMGANAFMDELHALIFPDASELPFQTLFVTKGGVVTPPSLDDKARDGGLIAAVGAMYDAASLIGESSPVCMGDTADASDHGLGFDAYLVSEALLIEAFRVVLEPHLPWKKPGGTVGSSSWPVACELLQNPQQLSHALHLCDILAYGPDIQDLLMSFFNHMQWPHSYDDTRPLFHMLLAFMMHVEHVYRLVGQSGGLLVNTNRETPEASAEHSDDRTEWHLHPQTSVLMLG